MSVYYLFFLHQKCCEFVMFCKIFRLRRAVSNTFLFKIPCIQGNQAFRRTIWDKFLFKTLVFQQNQAFFLNLFIQMCRKTNLRCNMLGISVFFSHRNCGKICLFELKNAGIWPNDLIFICFLSVYFVSKIWWTPCYQGHSHRTRKLK